MLVLVDTFISKLYLEDDEYAGLFITQSSDNSDSSEGILSNPSDFRPPCASLVSQNNIVKNQYSDILDEGLRFITNYWKETGEFKI